MPPPPPQIRYDGDREETHGTKNKNRCQDDLGEGRAVEEHGRERRRHRERGHETSLGRRHHGFPSLVLSRDARLV
jgi:hypothetical protein